MGNRNPGAGDLFEKTKRYNAIQIQLPVMQMKNQSGGNFKRGGKSNVTLGAFRYKCIGNFEKYKKVTLFFFRIGQNFCFFSKKLDELLHDICELFILCSLEIGL